MQFERTLLGLVLWVVVAGSATAQSDARLRWRGGSSALGLQPAMGQAPLPCGSYTFSCSGAAVVPLYTSRTASRSVSMQVGYADAATRVLGGPGVNLSVIGKAGIVNDLGVYGRVGTTLQRGASPFSPVASPDGGMSYGVGLSWDLSRSASAAFGWDSYDLRSTGGDARELRTSLGLQWRY